MTQVPLKTPIVYPEPDGAPMAESDPARDYLIYGVEALKRHFQDQDDVYVSGNLWLSYQQRVPDAVVCPDVFVVFGVENRPRTSYRVWQENGKTPDWVLEVTSASTRHKDDQDKPRIYADMGVTEYFQYDPTGDYLNPPLKGRRLLGDRATASTDNRYALLEPNRLDDGTLSFASQVLALELRLLADGRLRFFNPQTGEFLRSPDESERDRIQAQERAERAEADLQELRDRLRAKGIDPADL